MDRWIGGLGFGIFWNHLSGQLIPIAELCWVMLWHVVFNVHRPPKEDFLQMHPRSLSDLKNLKNLNELRRFMSLCKKRSNNLLRTARKDKKHSGSTYRFIQYGAISFSA